MSDLLTDVSYINRLSSYIDQFTQVRKDVWVGRCPVCGDSKKNEFKKRFYIFLNGEHYSVKCHNCSFSQGFPAFLKFQYPDLHKEYILDSFQKKNQGNQSSRFKSKKQKHIKEISKNIQRCKGFDYSSLRKFQDLQKNHPARLYVQERMIPFEYVLYAPKFSVFIDFLGINHYIQSYKNAHEPRMIIPFYRTDGKSTVFQARSFIKNDSLRYITIKENDSQSKIFGMDRVVPNSLVYVVEGPLDSLMMPNCIAMAGIGLKVPFDNLAFVFDNEPRNNDVVKSMRKRLIQGHRVCIMPESNQYKDLNDLRVKKGLTSEKILDLINDNLYSGNEGLLRLNSWRK